jgi:hypothetical protein
MTQAMPSQARLEADIGRAFTLTIPDALRVEVQLAAVHAGVPMNRRYCCYSAEFAAPSGAQLPQALYEASLGDESWPLLLTPIGPGEDGRPRLEAVFHYPIPQPAE